MAMKPKTVQIILRNLWPLLLLAKSMGLMPWKIRGERITSDGYIGRIHCIACIALYAAVEMFNVWARLNSGARAVNLTSVEKILAKNLKSIHIAFTVVHMIRDCFEPQTAIKIIENLKLYDRKIDQLGRAKNHRFSSYWIFAIPLLPLPVLLYEIWCRPNEKPTKSEWNTMRRLYNCSQLFVSFVVYLAALKVAGMSYLLYQRYRHLNECIVIGNTSNKGNSRLPVVTMHDLQYLHATLGRSIRILESTYSIEIFIWSHSLIWTLNYHAVKTRWYLGSDILKECDVMYAAMQALCICWVFHATSREERINAAVYFYNNRITVCGASVCPINLSTLVFISSLTLSFMFLLEDSSF